MSKEEGRQWYKEELIGNIRCKFETEHCYNLFLKRKLEELFYKLPLEVVLSFYLCDMDVAFVEKVVHHETGIDAAGMFQLGEGEIQISLDSYQEAYAPFTIYITFFHEFGHFVDFIMGKNFLYSKEEDYALIAKKEYKGLIATQICYYDCLTEALFGKNIDDKHIKELSKTFDYFKDPGEFFAQSYALYVWLPEVLKYNAKDTYKAFHKYFKGSPDLNSKDIDIVKIASMCNH